jgi:hypothetical protein
MKRPEENCVLFHVHLFTGVKQTIMKTLFLSLLLLPLLLAAQTVHRKGDKIVYEGEVTLPGHSASQINTALHAALTAVVKKGKTPCSVQANDQTLTALGDIKLNTNPSLSRFVNYTIAVTAKDGGYDYRIDSVYVIRKKGGGAGERLTAKKMLEDMEVSGPASERAEMLLNEIDMNFQKLLVLLKSKTEKETGARTAAKDQK